MSAAHVESERAAAKREKKKYICSLSAAKKPSLWVRARFGRYINLLNGAASVLMVVVLLASFDSCRTQGGASAAWQVIGATVAGRWSQIQTRISQRCDFTEEKTLLFERALAVYIAGNEAAEEVVHTLQRRSDNLHTSAIRSTGMKDIITANAEHRFADISWRAERFDFSKWMQEGVQLIGRLFTNVGRGE